ncbi:hypothetical protein A9Q80_07240 [Cycloclasticus sp. 46_83_sub15_T18]|nr:hypothetical protein A9Q80_07240 [Cycloclasticus sp. 46_83_sub15_T18]
MSNKKLIVLVLCCGVFSINSAYAIEPADNSLLYSESFWSDLFGQKTIKHEQQARSIPPVKQLESSRRLFSDVERSNIRHYYRRAAENKSEHKGKKKQPKQKQLPYGLQKKLARGGQLPPGWQNKVRRGEVLDANILSRSLGLPDELIRRLPAYEDGVVIRRVGDKVVRVLEGKGTVLDVIDLADIVLR